MSKDVTTKKNTDGTTTVWDSNGYAGKLPSDSSRNPTMNLAEERKAKIKELQRLISQAKESDAPQENIDEMYKKIMHLVQEGEEVGEPVEGFGNSGERPMAVHFGKFLDEEDTLEEFGDKYTAHRPANRDFDISEGANYTQSALGALSLAVQEGHPVMLWSKPGTGKTQTVIGLGRELDAEVIDLNGAQTPADELLGMSYIHREEGDAPEDASAPKIPPAWMRRVQNNPHKRFIVFLDEFSNAPPAVRAALLTVIQDRKAGDTLLGNNVTFVAAGNPVDHATNGFELDPATSNRFVHIDYDIPQDEAVESLEKGYWNAPKAQCTREDYESQFNTVRSLIVGYQKAGGAMHNMPDEDDPNYGRGWASPRSWDNLSSMLARARAANAHPETIEKLVRGTVGNSDGIEFLAYMEKNDLPPVKDVLDNPDGWKPPDTDRALATITAIMSDCRRRTDESGSMSDAEQWEKAGYVLKRLADVGMSDLAAANARDWLEMAPKGKQPPRALLTALAGVVRKKKN